MDYIKIAKDTINITQAMKYELEGKTIFLPEMDYSDVTVYSPEMGKGMLQGAGTYNGQMCKFTITTEDSFQAAARYNKPMVMNFANAHNPGGGFKLGATAQEEALCRCSTLYESISSSKASEMYRYNNTHPSKVESDYMLHSSVCVFRNSKCELLKQPFVAGVITVPAPNRLGAAMFASNKVISETMLRRIRIMLLIAKEHGYKDLVLGAWGCGAFHNKPDAVAAYFRQVLIEEAYGACFDEVCFAIYGREDGNNISAFRSCFKDVTA